MQAYHIYCNKSRDHIALWEKLRLYRKFRCALSATNHVEDLEYQV